MNLWDELDVSLSLSEFQKLSNGIPFILDGNDRRLSRLRKPPIDKASQPIFIDLVDR
jgi:hypothetical protein